MDFIGFIEFFAEWADTLDEYEPGAPEKDLYEQVLGVGFKYLDKHSDPWDITWEEFFKKARH
jgi:hypothetical protein